MADLGHTPPRIYVWLVPSEEVQEQPGSWRIRKWDTAPFPEANFALASEMPETNVVLKVYASKDHGVVAHINANGYGPGHFGLLLADCIRHVARAFNVDEGEVYEYVKREMSMPSTKIEGGRKQ